MNDVAATSDEPKLASVLWYLLRNYPHQDELSKARTTKLVYLADWQAAQDLGRQITGVQWKFNHYGPYVDDVYELANDNPLFEVVQTTNMYGSPKEVLRLASLGRDSGPPLTSDETRILDRVIAETSPLYWQPFIAKVYATYPVSTQPRYAYLDLVKLAAEARDDAALKAISGLLEESQPRRRSLRKVLRLGVESLSGGTVEPYVDADLPSECEEATFDTIEVDLPPRVRSTVSSARFLQQGSAAEIELELIVPAEGSILAVMSKSDWNARSVELDSEEGVDFVGEVNEHYVEVSVQRRLSLQYSVVYSQEEDEFFDLVLIEGSAAAED